jgi:hypothetical protein
MGADGRQGGEKGMREEEDGEERGVKRKRRERNGRGEAIAGGEGSRGSGRAMRRQNLPGMRGTRMEER